ncbi:MAG TPA: polysaccharide lyase family 8 super-sandwich domain-containing protein [Prolixibacteraceae bacterium]|nr:polysaccharide lyase family 8 super-sandwich domain-containing protein [Prolixibacteraceae bacterium]
MKHTIQLAFLFLLISLTSGAIGAQSDLETIRKRFIAEYLESGVDQTHIQQLISTIKPDGTWANINYTDVSKTGFQHGEHLNNLVSMCRAYKKADSKLKGNKKLKAAINSALDYWLDNGFICENWWWNQIGTPNAMISVLMVMDTDLSKEQIEKLLPIVGRANLNASGARPSGDRIKIAGILAKTLLFQRNEAQFAEIVKVIEGEIKFSMARGMQYDYSFHHREDWVNNTLSYGLGYADAFAEWAAIVSETSYQFHEKPLHQLVDYYLDGICKMMIFGKYPDTGAMNRDITRSGAQEAFGTKTPERLLQASDYRKSELEEIIRIRKGEGKATLSHATFYWNSDHFSFQRPDFYTSVRMYSTRNHNMEYPYNGEGLTNHHRGDGTNYISVTGLEYQDISPVYDWQKIPGTTILQKPELPAEEEIQKQGLTDFVGAVTDGKYGAAVFDFKSPHDPVEARKAWFFFDKEYVCLGAGINSRTKLSVVTTLNQCYLNGDVLVGTSTGKSVLKAGEHTIDNAQWIYHNGIGYIFPEAQKVGLSNHAQTGSWFKINRQIDSPKEEVSRDIFKLWINHGSSVQNGSYEYIVVPATSLNDMETNSKRPIEILANTPEIQAVKHSELNISQVVFYQSGEIQLSPEIKVGCDSPGIVMIKTDGKAVKTISVADPAHKLSRIHVYFNGKISKTGDNFTATWNEHRQITELAVDLPQAMYAGKSVTIDF